MKNWIFIIFITLLIPFKGQSQINQDQLGAWYMYFYDTTFNESEWGLQGDLQYRNWNIIGDLEQLLIRSGVTYTPKNTNIKFTVGYANIITGAFGDDDTTITESRIYQEAFFPTHIGGRFFLNHRLRLEQRFVENQDTRTRYRYNLFLNVPLNKPTLEKGSIYLSLYNEIFINGEQSIGNVNRVETFDRNRFYAALGFIIKKGLKVQVGILNQKTNNWKKHQLQISLHHKI